MRPSPIKGSYVFNMKLISKEVPEMERDGWKGVSSTSDG